MALGVPQHLSVPLVARRCTQAYDRAKTHPASLGNLP